MIYGTCEQSGVQVVPTASRHPLHFKFISYNSLIYILDFFYLLKFLINKRFKGELQGQRLNYKRVCNLRIKYKSTCKEVKEEYYLVKEEYYHYCETPPILLLNPVLFPPYYFELCVHHSLAFCSALTHVVQCIFLSAQSIPVSRSDTDIIVLLKDFRRGHLEPTFTKHQLQDIVKLRK